MTNTFVLPSWPGAYLAGARTNQWAWHRKHVTTVTSVTRSVVHVKVQPDVQGAKGEGRITSHHIAARQFTAHSVYVLHRFFVFCYIASHCKFWLFHLLIIHPHRRALIVSWVLSCISAHSFKMINFCFPQLLLNQIMYSLSYNTPNP